MSLPTLAVERLGVVTTASPSRSILHEVSFGLDRGSSVGLVGRSGSGKSSLGNAILGLLPRGLALTPGSGIRLGGEDLLTLSPEAMRRVRGRRIAMVFQEPLLALDPAMQIGLQLASALAAHDLATGPEAMDRALDMLAKVGIADPRNVAARYPHQLSGGMRQRLLLASALLLQPEVLIADEPTTALDPTLQAQLLDQLDALRRETGTALLLISHDLAVVAERCERVLLLDAGRITEHGDSAQVFAAQSQPPVRVSDIALSAAEPIIRSEDVAVHFTAPRVLRDRPAGVVRAVDGVSLSLYPGECLGLVGESGCGKTTFARALLGLVPLSGGRVLLDGADVGSLRRRELRALRKDVQLVPQDAGASLTPELTVGELVREGLEIHGLASGAEATRRTHDLLGEVGLHPWFGARYPRALSTGERQRVAIARALACEPRVLICDEPVANVDADARGLLLELLDRLRRERNLALLVISHDLGAVRQLASRVAVMYLGRIVERADSPAPLDAPRMPYTHALRAALPTGAPASRRAAALPRGELPSPLEVLPGCPYHPRCPHPAKDQRCQHERPELVQIAPGQTDHLVACWHDPLPRTP